MLPLARVADADRIDVGVDGDQSRALAYAGQQIAHRVGPHAIEAAQLVHLATNALDHAALLPAFGRNSNDLAQKRNHLLFVLFRLLEDC